MYTLINGVVTYVDVQGEVAASAAPVLRSSYSDHRIGSDDSALHCQDATLAQQHFKDECDINTIVERFGLGAEIPEGLRLPSYGDFTGINDYHTAVNRLAQARESFDALPASVRARFVNDPYEFVAFCSREESRGELEAMGLIAKRPAAAPVPPAASTPVPEPVK